MSDARSLLRAHRAANRIDHPHAGYSEAGKLLCKLCREGIKSETLWDTHLRSPGHRQRLNSLQQQQHQAAGPTVAVDNTQKRKLDEAMDVVVDDDENTTTTTTNPVTADDPSRKKRSRTDSIAPRNGSGPTSEREVTGTPPGLLRRTSSTPAQGIEISIPSRPATPKVGDGSQASTPNMPPLGRSPLIGGSGSASEYAGTPNTTSGSAASRHPQLPISMETLAVPKPNGSATGVAVTTTAARGQGVGPTTLDAGGDDVDEAEWAAFEAEIAAADDDDERDGAYAAEATISAPARTAAGSLAGETQDGGQARGGAQGQTRLLRDAEIAGEREDATRALEDEFEEMEELESRVRRLKERREGLRRGSNLAASSGPGMPDRTVPTVSTTATVGGGGGGPGVLKSSSVVLGKENVSEAVAPRTGAESEEDDDEEDEEDWDDGFRFHA